ncbi:MAG TPA: DUF432 domain-containing protein [Nitrosopumilus sp.]|nr:DUF432 domain-containing protein [Thermoproteota archaeon]HJJ23116.1 DUF432 domain-containing protein [Nitrosopumilus sp.]
MTNETSEKIFSNYGVYEVNENLELSFPNTEIKIERIGKNVFSYSRNDSESNLVKKIIPTKSNDLTIEISPIRPLNYPARRTSYMYLEFESPVFLSENSAATVFARCPIEIGVFLLHNEHKNPLDWFTCDPLNSRFGLYGAPDSGTLCKYSSSEIAESYEDSIPFFNAVLEINLKNELDSGHSISKVIFPISDYSVYYKNSKAIIDSVNAIMKKKITLEIFDVSSKPIQTDWAKSPTYEHTIDIKRIDMGVD